MNSIATVVLLLAARISPGPEEQFVSQQIINSLNRQYDRELTHTNAINKEAFKNTSITLPYCSIPAKNEVSCIQYKFGKVPPHIIDIYRVKCIIAI